MSVSACHWAPRGTGFCPEAPRKMLRAQLNGWGGSRLETENTVREMAGAASGLAREAWREEVGVGT